MRRIPVILLFSFCLSGCTGNFDNFDYPAFGPKAFDQLDHPFILYTPIFPQYQKGLYNTRTHQGWFDPPLAGDPGYFVVINTDTMEIECRQRWTLGRLWIAGTGVEGTEQDGKKSYFLTSGRGKILSWDHETGIISEQLYLGNTGLGLYPNLLKIKSGLFIRSGKFNENGLLPFYFIDPQNKTLLWEGSISNAFSIPITMPQMDKVFIYSSSDSNTGPQYEVIDLETKTKRIVTLGQPKSFAISFLLVGEELWVADVFYDGILNDDQIQYTGINEIAIYDSHTLTLKQTLSIPTTSGFKTERVCKLLYYKDSVFVLTTTADHQSREFRYDLSSKQWTLVGDAFTVDLVGKFFQKEDKLFIFQTNNPACKSFQYLDLKTGTLSAQQQVWVY